MSSTALIVDDNTSLAYYTAYSLRQEIEGLQTVTAGSCKEALALADRHHPSVLIVDLKLPDGNGLELITDLKSHSPGAVPVLITATSLSEDIGANIFGILMKPYEPEALIDLVRQALKYRESPDEGITARYGRVEPSFPWGKDDFHHVQNRLSGLLAGIRALRLELLAVADDPSEIRRTIDEYTDKLSAMVKEVAEALKRRT